MSVADEWLRLREAVRRVCDDKLLIHQMAPTALDESGMPEHREDCSGCELRAALAAVDDRRATHS